MSRSTWLSIPTETPDSFASSWRDIPFSRLSFRMTAPMLKGSSDVFPVPGRSTVLDPTIRRCFPKFSF